MLLQPLNPRNLATVLDKIDFLKLDIEGFELLALKGAYQMIMNKKINFIQIEISSASITTKSMLFDFWKMLNELYYFYLILNQGLIEIKEYKLVVCQISICG
jgi:hypothetical protein